MAEGVTTDNSSGKSTEAPEHKKLKGRHFWDTMNLGYLGAGVATLITAFESINKYFYHNSEKKPEWKIYEKKRETSLAEKLRDNPVPENGSRFERAWHERKIKVQVYKEFNKDVDEEFTKTRLINKVKLPGLKYTRGDVNIITRVKEGAIGSFYKLLSLEPHQSKDVLLKVAVVGSIALGAIFSFGRERHYTEKLEKQEADDDKRQHHQRSR